jgi:hypothetical protein
VAYNSTISPFDPSSLGYYWQAPIAFAASSNSLYSGAVPYGVYETNNYGNAITLIGSGDTSGYGGDSTVTTAPCLLLHATGPNGTGLQGAVGYNFTFSYSDASQIVLVATGADVIGSVDSWDDVTSSDFSESTTINGKSFDDAFVADTPTTSPTTINVNLSSLTKDFVVSNMEGWCYTGATWVDWGNMLSTDTSSNIGAGPGGETLCGTTGNPTCVSDGGSFDFAACTASNGIGLDPSSWVPGLVNWGVCGIRWLTEPSSSSVQSLENTFGISSNNPSGDDAASQWLGSLGHVLTTGPYDSANAILAGEEDGATSSVLTDTNCVDRSNPSTCVSIASAISGVTSTSHASTALTILAWLLTAGVGVEMFILLWKYIARLISGGS